ncbi:MAG: tetratricopeptide repeat protein [Phycisphaerales bacterium]
MNDWFDAESHVDRALDLFERGRWAEAEAELRKALALNPDQPEWHYNLGLTLEAAGRDAEAYLSFQRATELLPDEVPPAVSAGLAAGRLQRYEDASRWFERVLTLDPRNELAYANSIELLTRLGRHDEAETTFYLSQQLIAESGPCLAAVAESLIERCEFARAEWCLKEALRISPTLPRVRAQLGRVFAATGRSHRALHMYLRELRDDPGNIDALLDYGDLLFEIGRMPEAAEKFRRVLELQPANPEAHMRLGEVALRSARLEQAHLEFELVLKLDPGYPNARAGLAESLIQRNRFSEARTVLRAELDRLRLASETRCEQPDENRARASDRITDDDGTDLARLGRALLDTGVVNEAVRVLTQATKTSAAEDIDAWQRLAVAHLRSGNTSAGCAASRRVLRLDPECIEAMHNLALAALHENRLAFAHGWLRRGLAVDRHDEGLRRLRIRIWARSLKLLIRGWLPRLER